MELFIKSGLSAVVVMSIIQAVSCMSQLSEILK